MDIQFSQLRTDFTASDMPRLPKSESDYANQKRRNLLANQLGFTEDEDREICDALKAVDKTKDDGEAMRIFFTHLERSGNDAVLRKVKQQLT